MYTHDRHRHARPTLIKLYRRPGCHLCDDAEILLRDVVIVATRQGMRLATATVEAAGRQRQILTLEARYALAYPGLRDRRLAR